jgi:hypothetical protein
LKDEEHNKANSTDQPNNNLNSGRNEENRYTTYLQLNDVNRSSSSSNKLTLHISETKDFDSNKHDHGSTSQSFQYNRSTSMGHGSYQQSPLIFQKSKSVSIDPQNDEQKSNDTHNKEPILENLQENKQMSLHSTDDNSKNITPECNDHSPV